jgi:hypothetical protein
MLVLVVASLLGALGATLVSQPWPQSTTAASPRLAFAPGLGDTWQSQGPYGRLAFNSGGVELALPAGESGSHPQLRVRFAGAQTAPALAGEERLPGVLNSYQGEDPAQWRSAVTTYGALVYRGLYPGVDLRYDGQEGALKGTYTVAPGADPSAIRWAYDGAEAVTIDQASGDLRITLPGGGELPERAPVAWQVIGGRRVPVAARFTLEGGLAGFALGAYDPALPLVIDPELAYGTYLGGMADDTAYGITLDAQGFIYLTGRTYSDNFPRTGGARATDRDMFITKLDPTGKQIIYSTLVGGRSGDDGIAVAVNAVGEAVVTAYTASDNFPLKNPLLDTRPSTGGALVKLTASGALALSSYLNIDMFGGNRNLGLDQDGNIYLAGEFGGNIMVAKLSPAGEFLAEQQVGGRWPDRALGLAVSPAGRVYLTGETDGWDNDFPTTPNALQPVCSDRMANPEDTCNSEAFLVILEPSLEVSYSSYLGGTYLDGGSAVALDPQGNVVVVGTTLSKDFPMKNAVQPACPDGLDPDNGSGCRSFATFVTKFSPDGDEILFSTYFSSSDWSADVVKDVAIDRAGNIHVLGWTNSLQYPVKDAPQPNLKPGICVSSVSGTERMCEDAVITAFAPDGGLRYSTYLGGSGKEYPQSLAADVAGNIWVTGLTESRDFSVTEGSLQPQKSLSSDAFLARLGAADTVEPPPPPPPGNHRLYLPLTRRY